jgi:hypothetical protein
MFWLDPNPKKMSSDPQHWDAGQGEHRRVKDTPRAAQVNTSNNFYNLFVKGTVCHEIFVPLVFFFPQSIRPRPP